MSRLGPSHCRYICLKHRVAILRPQWKVEVHRNLTTLLQLYLVDVSCIWLILNEAQMHCNTTVGCNLEALVKGGSIQKLDSMHGHSEHMTCCQQGMNLKVVKMNKHLGSLDPIWAKCSKSGQIFLRSEQKNIHVYNDINQYFIISALYNVKYIIIYYLF